MSLRSEICRRSRSDRAAFNAVYQRFLSKPGLVRAAVGVASLTFEGMRVELTPVAAKG